MLAAVNNQRSTAIKTETETKTKKIIAVLSSSRSVYQLQCSAGSCITDLLTVMSNIREKD
jgi:hypothetical protein